MSVVALPSVKGLSKASEAARKPFLRRVYEAIVAARMAQAERELSFYIQRTGNDPRK